MLFLRRTQQSEGDAVAPYSNKFRLQVGDMVRIIFMDERAPEHEGGPMPISETGEQVMTVENALALGELLVSTLKDKVIRQ